MQLSLYTDYSLRVLLYLATHQDRRVTMSEIADAYAISHEHLRKVIHQLGKLGYLTTFRGKSGGFELKVAADQILLGEVIAATEPRKPVIDCQAQPCVLADSCALQAVLARAEAAFYDVLKQARLSDLVKNKRMRQILVQNL